MSWECRYRSGDHCNKLDVECDPGRTGCVLHGRFYFPFAPEKNTREMNEAAGQATVSPELDGTSKSSDPDDE